MSFFLKDNKLNFTYNNGWSIYNVTSSPLNLKPGKVSLRVDYTFDEATKTGTSVLYLNNNKIGEGRIEKTGAGLFSHEGLNVGFDDLTAVSETYTTPFAFSGNLTSVTIELKKSTKLTAGQ